MDEDKQLFLLRRHIDKMPPLSPTVTKVMSICNRRDTSPIDLNRVISLDPVLTGNVLRLINSAYYAPTQKVTSLIRAITMLGLNTIRNLLVSTAILGKLAKQAHFSALNPDDFWEHSLAVGVTAKLIAKKHRIAPDQLETFFIAGLLHDIGKIPLNNKFSDNYLQVINQSEEKNRALYMTEKEAFGIDHTGVGKIIAEKWHLGTEISDTIEYHHSTIDYKGDNKIIVYVVTLADYFINKLGIGFSGNHTLGTIDLEMLAYLKKKLGITLKALEDIINDISSEVEKSRIFLKLAGKDRE